MLNFYKTAAVTFLCLIISTGVILFLGVETANLSVPIFPVQKGAIPWTTRLIPTSSEEAKSSIVVNDDTQLLDWDFMLAADVPYPYTSYGLDFAGEQGKKLLDLRQYEGFSFRVRCSPQNVMLLVLFTQDDKVTVPNVHPTYRVSSSFFLCGESWSTIDMRFDDLDTPDWWLDKFELSLVNRDFRLDRVLGSDL